MKRRIRTGVVFFRLTVALSIVVAVGVLVLPQTTNAQQAAADLHVMPVRGNVFMIVGGGSNVTVSAGVDGILLVDTGSAAMADKVYDTVMEIGRMVTGAPAPMTT